MTSWHDDVEGLYRKLKPILGHQINSLWLAYNTQTDSQSRAEIIGILYSLASKYLDETFEKKILLKCEIQRPQEIIFFDDSLVNPKEIKVMLVPGGRILINTRQPAEAFKELSDFDLHFIDALSVSQAAGMGKIINTSMVGAYCRIMGHLDFNNVLDAVLELAPAKPEANAEAARRAYETIAA